MVPMVPTDWLPRPTVEIHDPEGIPSALIYLRDRPPAYSMQPCDESLVFVHLAADHWPVSIEIFTGVSAKGLWEVLARLIETPFGPPRTAVTAPPEAGDLLPMPRSELAAIFRAVGEAQERLGAAAA